MADFIRIFKILSVVILACLSLEYLGGTETSKLVIAGVSSAVLLVMAWLDPDNDVVED